MQIVIKISEGDYINLKNAINSLIENGVERDSMSKLCLAVLDGTPLPKGHGRLIDADELKRIIQGNDVLNMTGFNVRICDINATPTIIEADKESEG